MAKVEWGQRRGVWCEHDVQTFPASRGLAWRERRERDLCRFRRVVWWGRRPNFWSKLTGFQNRFRLMCYARALLDWTLTIIEPTVDNGFCEFRNFSIPAIKSSVSTLGDKRIKEITSLERKSILGFLKGRNKCVSPDGLRQIFNLPPQQYEWPPSYLLFTVTRISSLQNQWRGWWVSLRVSLVRIVMIES